jgi:hypothetical protein
MNSENKAQKTPNSIHVTYNKRKRGLLRKAIELSTMCQQDVFIVILDRQKETMVEFNSSSKFNHLSVKSLYD